MRRENEINNNIDSICSCFDKLDDNIEKINEKDEISTAFFKLVTICHFKKIKLIHI